MSRPYSVVICIGFNLKNGDWRNLHPEHHSVESPVLHEPLTHWSRHENSIPSEAK
jgi:hypothetical protein